MRPTPLWWGYSEEVGHARLSSCHQHPIQTWPHPLPEVTGSSQGTEVMQQGTALSRNTPESSKRRWSKFFWKMRGNMWYNSWQDSHKTGALMIIAGASSKKSFNDEIIAPPTFNADIIVMMAGGYNVTNLIFVITETYPNSLVSWVRCWTSQTRQSCSTTSVGSSHTRLRPSLTGSQLPL